MNNASHTFESVWATLDRVGEQQAETARRQKETDSLLKETDSLLKDIARQQKETDRIIKENALMINGISASNGAAAENYFYNALQHGNKKMFGEDFDDVFRGEKRKTIKGYEDEYDILLFKGDSVLIHDENLKVF